MNTDGVAVDGVHIYWADPGLDTIGRANLDGSAVDHAFVTGATGAFGLAIDASHIYWTKFGGTSIGRANLDGSNVNPNFIATGAMPWGLTVNASRIYWANGGDGTIGRALLDGTGAVNNFITGTSQPAGVAVDGSFIYWSMSGMGKIARANLLDGSNPNQDFIVGANSPREIALDSSHIYWANYNTGTVGRANLDGSGANQSFIMAASVNSAEGVAVDGLPQPPQAGVPGAAPPAFGAQTLVTLSLAAKRTSATGPLEIRVSNANGFVVAGQLSGESVKRVSVARKRRIKLKPKSFQVAARGRKTVELRLPRVLRRLLKRTKVVKLRLAANVRDPAGNVRTVKKRFSPKLKKARRR